MDLLRNLPTETPKSLREMISIQPGRVVSMSLSRSEHCLMTLLAFSEGESVSEEAYWGDTLYHVLEGSMPASVRGRPLQVEAGQCCMVPAGTLHAIGGAGPFKVLQITVSS